MKQVLRKITRWCAAVIMLLLACILPVSTCMADSTGENLVSQMQEAANIQLVTNKFIRCMEIDTGNGKLFFGNQNAITTGDIFANGGASQTDVLSGAWLEQQVQGKIDNGTIWCSNNGSAIVKVFMQTLGINDLKKLYCDGDRPGLMSMQVYKKGTDGKVDHWKTVDNACQIGVGSGDYKFVRNPNGLDYIRQLYEQKKESSGNPYMVAFDDVSAFNDPTLAYFLYLNDFHAACAGKDDYHKNDVSIMNEGRYFTTPLKVVDLTTGKIVERYYSNQNIKKNNWKDSYVVGGPHTCEDVIDRINGSGSYSDRQDLATAISETIATFRRGADIQSCLDKYKGELDKFGNRVLEYSQKQYLAKLVKKSLEDYAAGIQSGSLPYEEDEYGDIIYSDPSAYANGTFQTSINILKQGIDGKSIYNDELLSTIATAFQAIVANTVVNPDRITIDSRPEDVTFTSFNELLDQWQIEIQGIDEEIEAAKAKLQEKRDEVDAADPNVNSNGIWDYDSTELTLTCSGVEKLAEDFDGIFKEAPVDFDTNWSGVVLPDNDVIFDNTDGSTPTCYTDGSALGWILCPALEIMSNAVNGMYDTVANEWLEIGANEMVANDSSGVYAGWKTFRDAANVIFVIMLIIVIFSQVTGFGLTNYGIKKTLPTLIMIAVLVNLSFILCQLAVDTTNILGDGLRAMFEGMQVGTGTGVSLSDIVTGISSGLLQLAVVGGGVGLAVYFSGASFGMLLVPFLLALISALIGTVMFFLSLAIRKAGIFAMVVLCPVAVICYALPNTKKFFDRWLKLFTALLMVYPICGILMGGGKFFSSILLTSETNGFFMALTAMLIQVVPFFFIPSLVKGSLNMMGNIGAKLSNLGSRFTRTAQGALSRSHWAQDRQQRLARNANIRRDTRLANKWQQRLSKLEAKDEPNTRIGKAIRRRSQNRAVYEASRAADRFRRSAAEDARAAAEARRGLPTQGSVQYMNMLDAYENAAREREINEWQASMLNGNMSYGSGNSAHNIDVNNLGKVNAEGKLKNTPDSEKSLSAALLHYLDAYDNAADKNSDAAKSNLLKAQAIATRLLDAGGDNGQTIVTNALRGRTFGANGKAKNRNDIQSVSRLSEYIARNGKWMGQIKKTDVGSFSFLNDTANKTADIKDRAFYHTTGDKKITAAATPGLSDGFFEGIVHEIGQGTYNDANGDAAKRLLEIDAAASRAMADERIANEIKPETRDWLNQIHKKAYEIQQQRWLNGSTNGVANISQLKGYDSTGAEVSATGVDGEYLVRQRPDGSLERLMSAATGGVQLKADDAYQRSVRRYQELVAGQSQEELKIPHKRDIPYELNTQTNQYQAEDEGYTQVRDAFFSQPSNISQLSGYVNGSLKQAYSVDGDGFLRDRSNHVLLDASGNKLSANTAYDNHEAEAYAQQRRQWLTGTTNGKSNITLLKGYNPEGKLVRAAGVRPGLNGARYLVDDQGRVLTKEIGGKVGLDIYEAYNQMHPQASRYRDLRPEEQHELNKILDYNASVNIQHGNSQQN